MVSNIGDVSNVFGTILLTTASAHKDYVLRDGAVCSYFLSVFHPFPGFSKILSTDVGSWRPVELLIILLIYDPLIVRFFNVCRVQVVACFAAAEMVSLVHETKWRS